jgi:hypothetical protein
MSPGEREMVMTYTEQRPPVLVDLVRQYKVCSEVWPEYLMIDGQERQAGFELELSGTHELATQHIGRECPTCQLIYSALHSVTEWVLPKQAQPSMYQVGPHAVALRYSAVRGSGSNGTLAVKIDLALKVKVVQLRGFDQAVGRCEMRVLRETKEHLLKLAVGERQWSLGTQQWREGIRREPEPGQSGAAFVSSDLNAWKLLEGLHCLPDRGEGRTWPIRSLQENRGAAVGKGWGLL